MRELLVSQMFFYLNIAAELTISSKPVSKLSRVLLTIHFKMYYTVCVWLFIAVGTQYMRDLDIGCYIEATRGTVYFHTVNKEL